MSIEENKAVVRRLENEAWNKGNLAVADELIASNCVYHNAPPGTPPGPEGFKRLVEIYRTAIPDVRVTLEDLIAEGDKVVERRIAQGTHQGELWGIAPTSKSVTVTGIAIWHVIDGKVVERWESRDTLNVLQQPGAIPPAGEIRGVA